MGAGTVVVRGGFTVFMGLWVTTRRRRVSLPVASILGA
jgi:hypothetical protein